MKYDVSPEGSEQNSYTCNRCGAKGLRWFQKRPDFVNKLKYPWQVIEADGKEHNCEDQRKEEREDPRHR